MNRKSQKPEHCKSSHDSFYHMTLSLESMALTEKTSKILPPP